MGVDSRTGPIGNVPTIAATLSFTLAGLPTVKSTSLVSTPGDNSGVAMLFQQFSSLEII
jgi:hypothetical protein